MRRWITLGCLALIGSLPLTTVTAGNTAHKPELSTQGHQIIRAMRDASTWGHPDLYGQFSGMQAYARGRYKQALQHFKYGARYADKLSQLSIGLMYLNGQGVAENPARAWAWLSLAAERHYPNFVVTRDRVWQSLNAAQRTQAEAIRTQLAKTYADKVAKVRMRQALDYWRTQITGSRTGYNAGIQHMDKGMLKGNGGTPTPGCARAGLISAPISGCGGDIYAKWRWDPKLYFAVKDSRWSGTVSVGDLQAVDPAKADASSDDAHHSRQGK